jgi:hypothetical protein
MEYFVEPEEPLGAHTTAGHRSPLSSFGNVSRGFLLFGGRRETMFITLLA